ncbi:hypothetical protein HMPREF3038_01599 [Akkermansia sp. KLE1797]|nr:hypothetical protein HMPREF3038_01599 [Akkermansia sp. KLE1797]KZA05575.1 hypothetical protein HMPREF1326_00750 [Akkermansia sp. KLE1605]
MHGKLYHYQIFQQFQDVLNGETFFALTLSFLWPGFPFNSFTNFTYMQYRN